MSDQPGTESFEDDLGSVSLDDGVDAGSGQDQLLDSSEGDNEPSSPPDLQPRATEWGTTAFEQGQEETIEQRIRQEVPDPDSAYGAPDNEGGLDPEVRVGGSDPDAIAAEDDFLGDDGVGAAGVGQLTDPDEGDRPDVDSELLGYESAPSGDPLSPEEAAMHVVED
ncbi:hypothetical protein BJ986_000856 [Phycicoccus badiiscoriae]|uniref:DUF5709 domain-containing protein n=1 Tax=Pedococcus badiiscoriae TaxID=642776 RepID=A0A852WC43_9MICO|nr:DUF5709 domain-containing protein [Pedococcus badiiscoriae]NYG06369.1 hypothetical protein [Pedococcus badiiscoriae]